MTIKPNQITSEEVQFKLIESLTPAEKYAIVSGGGMGIASIDRANLNPVNFADASAGVRICDEVTSSIGKSTAFPCPLLMAATWHPQFINKCATKIGEECRAAGVHVLLGPGMNMYRHSRYGRNFEYFGEDPFLVSSVVTAYVKGLQSTGTMATLKHWIGNETDLKRCSSNTIMSERALREIYLPPFLAGIKAGAGAIMAAYNQFAGEWCAENRWLVKNLLREELGFKGMVMTDWDSTYDGMKLAESGIDLEMPHGLALRRVQEKLEGSDKIEAMVKRIVAACESAGFYQNDYAKPQWKRRINGHKKVALQVNEQAITLLKNDGILPLGNLDRPKRILVTGNAAVREHLSGGGSSFVRGYDNQSYLDALKQQFGVTSVVHFENPSKAQIEDADYVFIFSAFGSEDPESEGNDHAFELPDDSLISRCAKANPRAIVSLVTGCGVSMDWNDKAAAVLWLGHGGQTAAAAFCNIITGRVSPSGKLPFTIERRFEDSPAYGYDKVKLKLSATMKLKDIVPEAKHEEFFTNPDKSEFYTYDVNYSEDIHIGYRWYQSKGLSVRYPFGHGLTYSKFEWSDIRFTRRNQKCYVSLTLTHTSGPESAEVAQLYVSPPNASEDRPPLELKAFKKVRLPPGESKRIRLTLEISQLRQWNQDTAGWEIPSGTYQLKIVPSSADLRLETSFLID